MNEEHNFKLKCEIENGSPLQLTLIGRGVSQVTEGVQTLKFETIVRTKTSQKVTIKNPIAERITIKANISALNDGFKSYFQGADSIQLNPNDKADYEISYLPLTMTANPKAPKIKEAAHEGKLFFPMPDGSALMFNLVGKSNPSGPAESTTLTLKSKTEITHTINLNNWLKEVQRFNVQCDLDTKDDSIIISYAKTIDVPAEGTKKYKLTLMALKQGLNKLTVTFRNPHTDEFIYHLLNLNIGAPEPTEATELTAMVRDIAKKVISINNPLDKPVEIKKEQIIIDTDTLTVAPLAFTIPPKSVNPLLLSGIRTRSELSTPGSGRDQRLDQDHHA